MGPLALGFEALIFVPYGRKRCDLDKARKGDNDRAFSASVGASVLTEGLIIVPYILEGLGAALRGETDFQMASPTIRWRFAAV